MLSRSFNLPNGTPISYQRYRTGKVNVQAKLTYNPTDPRDVEALARSIRSMLPFQTTEVSKWIITTTHGSMDIPIRGSELRGFRLPEFEHNGKTYHAYSKPMPGGRVLRIESYEFPHILHSDYPEYMERAHADLLGVCGR
jgi:hypothetical protein